jgi:hypothetical protein
MTGNTQKTLDENKLKDRMNFAKMFERQEKQIKETPHIQNLLKPSTEDQEDKSMHSRIQHLEDKYNTEALQQAIDLKLAEVELSMVKTLTNSLEKLELKRRFSFDLKFDFNNRSMVYKVCSAILIAGLLAGIGLSSGKQTIVKEKIVYKEAPKKTVPQYIMTKYVNIRAKASTSGVKIETLPPNSIIEILDTQKGWKKIKFKNHLTGKTLTGWAYGENLKRIN